MDLLWISRRHMISFNHRYRPHIVQLMDGTGIIHKSLTVLSGAKGTWANGLTGRYYIHFNADKSSVLVACER